MTMNHLLLPCSKDNLLEEDDGNLVCAWEYIEPELRAIATIEGFTDFVSTWLAMYTGREQPVVTLQKAIRAHGQQVIQTKTIPALVALVLSSPEYEDKLIPLLPSHPKDGPAHCSTIIVSRRHCAVVLASAFMGVLPCQPDGHNRLNFLKLFGPGARGDRVAKIRALFAYFEAWAPPTAEPDTALVIHRRSGVAPSTPAPITLSVELDTSITDVNGMVQADFANAYLGGGVLGGGCVQEEVMFAEHPELMLTMALCQKMGTREAVLVLGHARYTIGSGYGSTYRFSHRVTTRPPVTTIDGTAVLGSAITAIDAIPFGHSQARQWSMAAISREVYKAVVGFMPVMDTLIDGADIYRASRGTAPPGTAPVPTGVATGHWGCGAFGGNRYLKALLQVAAAMKAGTRHVTYCCFGDEDLMMSLSMTFDAIVDAGWSGDQLLAAVIQGADTSARGRPLGEDEIMLIVRQRARRAIQTEE